MINVSRKVIIEHIFIFNLEDAQEKTISLKIIRIFLYSKKNDNKF